ncbi:MAG: acylphosphatase [Candidatus Thermoplasmatota archaeon]|jgi:acylphosphatase|nr:acylphosphatase [Candidatus Thermoplasmatota archaeon]MCL5793311.1 acylphosphatase [Candidatus Thermoplasmatota archaeon]
MKSLWIRFTGRVQGVNFRRDVSAFCRMLGISGWIRNNPDGSVEGEFHGDDTGMTRLLDALEGNFENAFITGRDVREIAWKDEKGFRIEH